MSDLDTPVVRRFLRTLALAPAAVVPLVAAPALAAPPETWEQVPGLGPLGYLMVLFVIPLGLAVVITLLASLPAMTRGDKYTPGGAWRNENEWFGGPKDGLEAADKADPKAVESGHADRGGARARW